MNVPEVLALSVALAMDATAVAATRGLAAPRVRWRDAAALALCFGGFQALMPAIGIALGAGLGRHVERWDHWIAFVLLGGVGAKMLHEAFSRRDGDGDDAAPGQPAVPPLATLLALGVATSIDSLAAGVTLPLLDAPPALAIASIGVITALCTAAGAFAGRRFGALLGRRLDALGGLALLALGGKILVEHLTQR